MNKEDLFRGCLIGGAAGDALGYTVEFWGEREIFREYGSRGITAYEKARGLARISDDTQMTMFTAAGLIKGEPYAVNVYRSYLDWLGTQERDADVLRGHRPATWLSGAEGLYARRAPGGTCLSALRSGAMGTMDKPLNNSKGCGGVMRSAPAGLIAGSDEKAEERAALLGAQVSVITHGHPLGYLPGAALAHIVWQLTHSENSSVRKAAADTADVLQALFAGDAYLPRFLETMKKAVEFADNGLTDLENIHALGEGWVGDEALFIGLYCAVRYSEDIDSALIAAVNHRGDSDSTGAVAGNIVGAHLGMSGIPEKYTKDLELTDEILTLADDLLRYDHDAQMNEAVKSDPEWVRKYCVSEI